jgi:hypothetical protein
MSDTDYADATEMTTDATEATTEAAEKPAKPKREPKPKVPWPEMWKHAPSKVDARIAKGLPAFKEGSKRDITRILLSQEGGCTIAEAEAALAWNPATCFSSFTEVTYLLHQKLVTTKTEGEPNRYSMIPTTDEELAEAKQRRADRRAQIVVEKQQRLEAREARKAAAEAAAEAQRQAAENAAAAHATPHEQPTHQQNFR